MSRFQRSAIMVLPAHRLLLLAALALGLGWLAVQVVLNVAAHELAREKAPELSITDSVISAPLVASAEGLILAGEQAIKWIEVEHLARKAVAANPLEHRALLILALVAEARSDNERARSLMRLAGARSMRDLEVHQWLFEQAVRAGDFAKALEHADIVLRVHPGQRSLYRALTALSAHPDGAAAMATILERNPPWRGNILAEIAESAADPADPLTLLLTLQSTSYPPSGSELRPYLERLIAAGRFEQALLLWRRFLPSEQQQDFSFLYNGGFEYKISHLPFDWIIQPLRGAEIDVVHAPLGQGRALQVQFARGRVPFQHVGKLLMLPPGSYQFSGQAEARYFGNQRGMQWRITCAEGEQEVLAATERLLGTSPRHPFSAEFAVPMRGCRAQWLRLELAARSALEQEVEGGTLWYDSLDIRRLAPRGAHVRGS